MSRPRGDVALSSAGASVTIKAAAPRLGSELRVGGGEPPWSREGLRALLKAGAGTRTLVLPARDSLAFVCGGRGHRQGVSFTTATLSVLVPLSVQRRLAPEPLHGPWSFVLRAAAGRMRSTPNQGRSD